MKTKFNGILTLLLAFVVQVSFAQTTVSGIVSDESGPLPGANVIIKGTNTGTQTDFDGNYSIKASPSDILVFSFVGFTTQEITVGSEGTINVSLALDNALDEVVVTALGIRKEKKSLGYAVSTVKSEDLEQRSSGDIATLLRGQASGVNITTTSGLSGSSSNVVIRGFTSLTGSNQALFVIDGVPFTSDVSQDTAFFDNIGGTSNAFSDIDPNNIESVEVLKGLSAATLYGNRGRNGVILITTKSGSKTNSGAAKVTVSTSTFLSTPHLPKYQDDFGGGFNQEFGWFFSNWGPSFEDTNPASFGTYFSSSQGNTAFVTHPFATNQNQAFVEGFEDLRDSEYEYRAYDSVENFFRTGVSTNISVGINGGNEDFTYNATYSNLNDEGFTPGNRLRRDNFSVGGAATKGKLKLAGTLNYVVTDLISPPIAASRGSGVAGAGASIFSDLIYTPRNVDLQGIPSTRLDGGSIYYRENNSIQHPLWTVDNSKTGQLRNNIFGTFSAAYQLNDWITATYRYGLNTSTENNFYGQNAGGTDGNLQGLYRTTNTVRNNIDHNLSLSFEKPLNSNFTLSGTVGGNSNRLTFLRDGVESTNQVVQGVLRHFNFVESSTVNSFSGANFQFETENNVFGVFTDLTLNYKDFLFVNGQARQDWTSVLESDNNSIFYPSASLSFLPTTAFEGLSSTGGLNYLKLRFGYGESAGFPDEYSTRTQLGLDARRFVDTNGTVVQTNSNAARLGNPNLEPESVREFELGVDSRFFNNRLSVNASIFKKTTQDLIFDRNLGPSTGFTVSQVNGGELEIEGIELDINADIFKNRDGFSWNVGINFYADESEIVDLDGLDITTIGGQFTAADARNVAVVGQPYGVFAGTTVQTDDDGNLLVGDDGNYLATASVDNIIGDPNADFTSTINTSISWKNITLAASVLYRQGGDVFSTTVATLQNRGLIDFPLSRFETFILPGVNNNTGLPNTTQINATDLAFDNYLFGPANFRVYDGTSIRLNEVSLSYAIPTKFIEKTPFSAISMTVSGSNLWYKAFNIPDDANFDPNVNSLGVGNNVGLDFFTGPSAKRFGYSLKLTF